MSLSNEKVIIPRCRTNPFVWHSGRLLGFDWSEDARNDEPGVEGLEKIVLEMLDIVNGNFIISSDLTSGGEGSEGIDFTQDMSQENSTNDMMNDAVQDSYNNDGPGPKKGSYNVSKQYGDVFNFFNPNIDGNYSSWLYASEKVNEGPEKNTVTIYSHGSDTTVNQMKVSELHEYLLNHSPTYKNSVKNGKTINVKLMACLTGNGIARELSKLNPNANVSGFTSYWTVYSIFNFAWDGGLQEGGITKTYRNGQETR